MGTPKGAVQLAQLLADLLRGQVKDLADALRTLADDLGEMGDLLTHPDADQRDDDNQAAVQRLFDHWCHTMGKQRAQLTTGRRTKIRARLKEGYTEKQIAAAILGCAGSEFHMEKGHNDITLICRNGEKLEWFMEKGPAPAAAAGPKPTANEEKVERLRRALRLAGEEGRQDDYERINGELRDAVCEVGAEVPAAKSQV